MVYVSNQLAKLSPDDMKVISNMQLLAGSSKKKSSTSGGFSLKFSNQKVRLCSHFMLMESQNEETCYGV